ncbi:hypothetical protein HAX54_010755 [Datura stramonium]|uniref:C2 domain-containing protein n=1 Tax=Datura stramonium TaxID=4076 RepID=A0ABS8RIV9_DATST|nr:hypothetical protein [Datura stramonium]
MEARYFYFTLHSASNLVDVRKLGEMKVYAKVSIAGKSKCTEVDAVNKTNPEWNSTLCFIVPKKDIKQGDVPVHIDLFCQRSLSHDKKDSNQNQNTSFGTLKFSYKLGEKILVAVLDSSSSPPSSSSSQDFARKIGIASIGVGLLNAMATALN